MISKHFPPIPSSARAAREFVRMQLRTLGVDVWPADLLVSELVANAIEHGPGDADFAVTVSLHPLRVGVTDGGRAGDVKLSSATTTCDRGRGLLLVDELAKRWGVCADHRGRGKTVWFELER